MTTYYNIAFEEKQYRSIANKAAKYYQESGKSGVLPLITADVPDAYEYRYTNLLDPFASSAGSDWSATGRKGSAISNYLDIDLFTQQMNLFFDLNEINKFGSSLIADKRAAIVEKWAIDVDDAQYHGPKNQNGIQLAEGLLGQLTCLVNQTSATGFNVGTKGEIWLVLQKAIDDIPFALREEGPDMILYINEALFSAASKPDRIYQDRVEWDFIYDHFIGPKAVHGRKIGQVIITNKINAEATDATNGNNANTVDTLGTHGRFLLIVPDPRWVGRIVSRGFSLVGEEQGALGVAQIYGWKGRAYFFNGNCANYTEGLTFA